MGTGLLSFFKSSSAHPSFFKIYIKRQSRKMEIPASLDLRMVSEEMRLWRLSARGNRGGGKLQDQHTSNMPKATGTSIKRKTSNCQGMMCSLTQKMKTGGLSALTAQQGGDNVHPEMSPPHTCKGYRGWAEEKNNTGMCYISDTSQVPRERTHICSCR